MERRTRSFLLVVILAALVAAGIVFYRRGRAVWYPPYRRVAGKRTVADILQRYGPATEGRLRPRFGRAGVAYPPERAALLAFKEEKQLELWAQKGARWAFIRSYPILAASGTLGPKLREGDRQVPEGIYRIVFLNPNSSYHLSMMLDYPSRYDRQKAQEDGRTNLGGEVFIHGRAVSIGCIAVGDPAIEDLFVLVARTGASKVTVIIAPNDLRRGGPLPAPPDAPPWLGELYETIRRALWEFPPPPPVSHRMCSVRAMISSCKSSHRDVNGAE